MDTLTSSVSALRVPSTLTPSRELLHLKNHTARLPHRSPSRRSNSISKPPNFLSTQKILNLLQFSPSSTRRSSSLSSTTGRLPDTPLCSWMHLNPALGSLGGEGRRAILEAAENEANRMGFGRSVGRGGGEGRLVREIAAKGGFERLVVKMTKMLIEKKRLGILKEVLSEFERIYDEFCGTKVVLVSSSRKMEEGELFGIAKNVKRMSGAVKVKVRSFIHGRFMA